MRGDVYWKGATPKDGTLPCPNRPPTDLFWTLIGSAVANPSVVNPDANRWTVPTSTATSDAMKAFSSKVKTLGYHPRSEASHCGIARWDASPWIRTPLVSAAKRWRKRKPSAEAMAHRSNAGEAGLTARRFRSLVASRLVPQVVGRGPFTHPRVRGPVPMVSKYSNNLGSSTRFPSTAAPTPDSIATVVRVDVVAGPTPRSVRRGGNWLPDQECYPADKIQVNRRPKCSLP